MAKAAMRRWLVAGSFVGFLLLSTACGRSAGSAFVGTYALEEHGQLEEFLRITERDGKLYLSEKQADRWINAAEVRPMAADDFHALLGAQWERFAPVGLTDGQGAVLQVKKGSRVDDIVCNTGYLAILPIGWYELHKQ